MSRASLLLAALWLLSALVPARAGIVIYRCTDAYGHLTVQNDVPCPKGTLQQKQMVEPPPPMPAYQPAAPRPAPAARPPAPSADAAPVTPAQAATPPLPPPPLYRCSTPDAASYFSEDGDPPARCIALPVVGLDGTVQGAGGSACERIKDRCERVPEAAACPAWRQRLREAEAAWRFGRADVAGEREAEFGRLQRLLRDSTCGQPGAG